MMPLTMAKAGETVTIKKITGKDEIRLHLAELGFVVKAIIEEKEIRIPMFKVVSVVDVSQTSGKPLPQLAADLSGNVQQYEVFMEALRRATHSTRTVPFRSVCQGHREKFSSFLCG